MSGMQSEKEGQGRGHGGSHHCSQDQDKGKVTITVDKQLKVPFGKHTVAEIKALAGVPASFELEVVANCRLIPLKDDETITIEGGEHFSAQPRCGVAS